jgi:hypothetical protein
MCGNLKHPPETHNICDASRAKRVIFRNLGKVQKLITFVTKPYVFTRFRARNVLARNRLARSETCENTGFGHKCYEFLDFSKISNNDAFRSGGVANVMSFRGMFQVTARARTPRGGAPPPYYTTTQLPP